MRMRRQKGFTLIELLVSLAVLMVLVGLGVPSFVSAMKNSRLNADYSQLVSALYLARSEAVKRSSNVTVCARATDNSCGNNWDNGWLVFSDNTANGAGVAGVVDINDEIFNIVAPLDGRNVTTLATVSPNPSSAANSGVENFVRYNPRGGNNWSGGTFIICDDRAEESALALHLVLTGDIRKGRTSTGHVIDDLHGLPVVCP